MFEEGQCKKSVCNHDDEMSHEHGKDRRVSLVCIYVISKLWRIKDGRVVKNIRSTNS